MGHINTSDQSAVVDRHKIRRERSKLRKPLQKCIDADLNDPFALYFNGCIDRTLKNRNKDYKCSKSLVNEEHICLLQEPRSSYVSHLSPKTGSSKNISEEIFEVLNSSLKSSNLRAIGRDETNVNTGTKNRVIVALARALSRPLQWIVCQLHGN